MGFSSSICDSVSTEIEGYLVGSGKLVKDVIGGGDNDTDAGLDVGGIGSFSGFDDDAGDWYSVLVGCHLIRGGDDHLGNA